MVRLDARLGRLEGRGTGDPAQVRQWVAMMTALITFGQEREDVTPEMAGEVRAQAEEFVRRGIPATISDWFRELHDGLADGDEGGA